MSLAATGIERYDLGPLLGEGGQSRIHEAEDRTTKEHVVVKFVKRSERSVAAGLGEVSALLSLNHPNIVKCLDFHYMKDGSTMLVYNRVMGGSLRSYLKDNQPTPFTFWQKFTVDVLSGLQHLHARGLVHCDLKPENILVEEDESLWGFHFIIADLGMARFSTTGSTNRLSSGSGSPAYMSAEAFNGNHSAQSDLYAVGIILYEMAAGMRPFSGDIASLARSHAYDPVDFSKIKLPHVTSFIDLFVRKRSRDRVSSASEALKFVPNGRAETFEIDPETASRVPTELEGLLSYSSDDMPLSLADFSPRENYSIHSTAKNFEVIEHAGKPIILAEHMNHFEAFDGLTGCALNQFVSKNGNQYQILNGDTLVTFSDSHVYLWNPSLSTPKLLTAIGNSAQSVAVSPDYSNVVWTERNQVFLKNVEKDTCTPIHKSQNAGLTSQLFFTSDGSECILIPGTMHPTIHWFNTAGTRTGSYDMEQPLLETSKSGSNIGLTYPSEQKDGGSLVICFFSQSGNLTFQQLNHIPNSYSFCKDGLVYEAPDGRVILCRQEAQELDLGQNPDRSSTLLFPYASDFFFSIITEGLRRHFKLYKFL